MGKSTPKVRSSKDTELDQYDEKVDELYRPFLIHSTTYVILTDQILSLMPSERNVLLTMNEYSLNDVNPMHPCSDDSPTHVIIFCIRFIADDTFQPIGGLLIYKQEDQSLILAECLKAYINDLWKLGLYVIATVSPPFETFKGILNHLVDIKNVNTYSGAITYSVTPFKEIVHVYDIQFLLIKLQNLLREGDIKFIEETRECRATWNDISLVLNLCAEFKTLSNYLLDNKDASRRVHIFTQQIFEQILEIEAQGILSECAGGIAVLLNCVRTFLQFTETNLVDLNLVPEMDSWDGLTHILQTMTFQKSKKRTCTKVKPSNIHTITNASTRRKLNFQMDTNTDVERLPQTIDKTLSVEQKNFEKQVSDTATESSIFVDQIKQSSSHHIKNKQNISNNSKQKKGKKKKSDMTITISNNSSVNQSAEVSVSCNNKNEKLHKKPSVKLLRKQTQNSGIEGYTEFQNNMLQPITNDEKLEEYLVKNKPYYKTDNFLDTVNSKNTKSENFVNDFNCDNNNNGSENVQNTNKNSTTPRDVCDNKGNIKKHRKLKRKDKEENFEIVINDAQKFFEYFSECSAINTCNNIPFGTTNTKILPNNIQNNTENDVTIKKTSESDEQVTSEKSVNVNANRSTIKYKRLFLYDGERCEDLSELCSQSDEKTETCIINNCDKVPNIVGLLDNVENQVSEEFEQNSITYEMLCTVFGMKKIIGNLTKRRMKVAKPDAFIVEHIDFLVTLIKKERNKINPVYYYGHNYQFLNAELAFVTLHNKNGLYLISK